jgi:tetratricopeptide (TPR) repeat protein
LFYTNSKELQEIQDLIKRRMDKKANQQLEIYRQKNLTKEERLKALILYSQIMLITDNNYPHCLDDYVFENYKKGLKQIEEAIKLAKHLDDKFLLLNSLLIKIHLLIYNFQHSEIPTYLESAERLYNSFDTSNRNGLQSTHNYLVFLKGEYYHFNYDFEIALNYYRESLKSGLEYNDKYLEVNTLFGIAEVKHKLGDTNQASEYFSRTLDLAEELEIEFLQRACIWTLSVLFGHKGLFEQAVKLLDTFEEMRSKAGFKTLGDTEVIKAQFCLLKGRLDEAIDFGEKAIIIGKQEDTQYSKKIVVGCAEHKIGQAYIRKGKIDSALDYAKRSYKTIFKYEGHFQRIRNLHGNSIVLLAQIYHQRGEYEQAISYYSDALNLYNEIGSKLYVAPNLMWLFQLYIELDQLEKAEQVIDELKKLEKEKQLFVTQKYRLAKGLLQKTSSRPKDWINAENLLEEIISEDITDYYVHVTAIVNLCELLLKEFEISGDVKVLIELKNYTNEILEWAKRQDSFTLRIEAYNIRLLTLWYQAQHNIINLDVHKLQELLEKAKKLTVTKGFEHLSTKITQQNQKLIEQIDRFDIFIRKYYEFVS